MNKRRVPTSTAFLAPLVEQLVEVGTRRSPGITNESNWTVKRFNAPERGSENYIHLDLNKFGS